jgi:hypothetical protein
MQRGPIANNLAFIEYDLAIINADHGPELIIEELLPAVFDVFRESDPVADSQRDLLSLEHTELPCLVEWQLLLDAVLSDNDSFLLPAKDFPLLPLLKSLFWDSSANSSLGHPVKLYDLPWLIGDRIQLLGISQVQSLKPVLLPRSEARKTYCRSVFRELPQRLIGCCACDICHNHAPEISLRPKHCKGKIHCVGSGMSDHRLRGPIHRHLSRMPSDPFCKIEN